ncbi:MAG: YkgJ family cysteine cluster protein [Candidatus Thorarchaeota archaeon]
MFNSNSIEQKLNNIEKEWYLLSHWEEYIDSLIAENMINLAFRELRYLSAQPPFDKYALKKLSSLIKETERRDKLLYLVDNQNQVARQKCCEVFKEFLIRIEQNDTTEESLDIIFNNILLIMDYPEFHFWIYLFLSRVFYFYGKFKSIFNFTSTLLDKYQDCSDAWYLLGESCKSLGQKEAFAQINNIYKGIRGNKNISDLNLAYKSFFTQDQLKQFRTDQISLSLLCRFHPKKSELNTNVYFKCNNCGDCCKGNILISESDIEIIKTFIGIQRKFFVDKTLLGFKLRTFNNNCIFHDDIGKKCNIYNYRPEVCRKYPFQEIVLDKESFKVVHRCPGISKL